MGRARKQKARDRNKQTLPQVPKNMKILDNDVEFDLALTDHKDLEAMAKAKGAVKRAKRKINL